MGIALELAEIDTVDGAVEKLLHEDIYSKESMLQMRDKYLYNVSKSAEVGANYIIKRLIEMSKR